MTRRAWSLASTVVALALLVVVVGLAVSLSGIGGEVVFSSSSGVSDEALARIALGGSLEEVARVVGPGAPALEFPTTGTAVEPMDADCRYYLRSASHVLREIVQLCYRDERLVSKRVFSVVS